MTKNLIIVCVSVLCGLFFCVTFTFASDYTIPQVKIYNPDATAIESEFLAYDKGFKGGVYIAAGDIDGDQKGEIITGAGQGGGPHVRFFNKDGSAINSGFMPFHPDFRGGVTVAAGDIDGDGTDEIICGQASAGQAWVKVYDSNLDIISTFLAYPESFEGGVFVAAGDLDGDGKDEILTGANAGGGPHVRAFTGDGSDTGLNFFPFPSDFQGGVTVAAGDVDKDGKDEVIVGAASDASARVKVYEADASRTILGEYVMYPESFQGGVFVGTGDVDGDGADEIITGAAAGGGSHVRVIEYTGVPRQINFVSFHPDFKGGVKVAGFDFAGDGSAEILSSVGRKKIISSCKKGDRCVAVTLDDGYSNNNSFGLMLDILRNRGAKATFFLLGDAMQRNVTETRRVVSEGHQLVNHSFFHPAFTRITEAQIKNEIEITDRIARSITGKSTKPYFRYPYGDHNAWTDAVIAAIGYRFFHWTATTGDSGSGASPANALSGALANLHDGSIILAHTQSPATASALDSIITEIQNRGYKLVTIEELENREK